MTVGEVIQVVVPGLVFPIWTLHSARIGGTYRSLRLPSVWVPMAFALMGGAVAGVALVTGAGLALMLGSSVFLVGWLIAFIRVATLHGKFLGLMSRLTRYLDPAVRPEHPRLVEKDFLELRRLVLLLQPAVPDGETMLRQIDGVIQALRR